MIKGFEDVTAKISANEKEVYLPLVVEVLSHRVGCKKAATNKMIREYLHLEDSVTPVSLTFKTADASKTSDSSTRSAVKMKVKYPDCRGSNPSPEVTYEDITQYIQGSEKVYLTYISKKVLLTNLCR